MLTNTQKTILAAALRAEIPADFLYPVVAVQTYLSALSLRGKYIPLHGMKALE